MEIPSAAIVGTLTYLLPGFVAAAIVYSLTPSPRPIPFERVVQALILTIVVQAFVIVARGAALTAGRVASLGVWSEDSRLVLSVVIAVALGVLWARFLNNDRLHALLRRGGFTQQTSYTSEWYGAFCQNKEYVVLHLKGARRLYGWPEEWPSVPDRGHFVMTEPEWLDGTEARPATGVARILIAAADVEMVELMASMSVKSMEGTDGRSQSTDAVSIPAAGAG